MANRRFVSTLLFILGMLAGQAEAHDYWLEPDHFRVAPGQEVKLRLVLGENFVEEKEQLYQGARMPQLDLYASPKRKTSLLDASREGKMPLAAFSLPQARTWLVTLDRNQAFIGFGYTKFLAYAQAEGLNLTAANLPSTRKTVRECYQRSLKTLLQCGDKTTAIATGSTEQEFQIVLTASPYRAATSGKLSVKVLYQGQPSASRKVTVYHRLAGKTEAQSFTTDEKGHGIFHFVPNGRWLIRCVHLEPVPAGSTTKADWQSWWTSLTFGFD